MNQVVGLFPELNLSQFAIVPTIGHDAVVCWSQTCQVSGLRRACHRWKRWLDPRQRTLHPKGIDSRCVFAQQRFGQTDDIDDGGARHKTICDTTIVLLLVVVLVLEALIQPEDEDEKDDEDETGTVTNVS